MDVRLSDAGTYECQMTTHPPTSLFFILKVVGKQWRVLFSVCVCLYVVPGEGRGWEKIEDEEKRKENDDDEEEKEEEEEEGE